MGGSDDRLEDAIRAARLYYLGDLTMDAIAGRLHTSRSTVSRLLALARERGYVEFRLHDPREAAPQLEREVAARFGVRAHVVADVGGGRELETLDQVARYAARVLNAFFDSEMVLGVAWGRTVSAVSHHLLPKATRNGRVVQLNGAGNPQTTGVEYASEILRRFGTAYRASVEQFPVPTFFDFEETKRALWRERSVQRVLALQQRADVVLFGIGTAGARVPGHVYRAGYLEPADIDALAGDGVVGDVATVFLRRDGTWRDVPLNARSSGPDLAELAAVPERLCVVFEAARVTALRAAIAAGLVSQLVIDEASAGALLALPDLPSKPEAETAPQPKTATAPATARATAAHPCSCGGRTSRQP